MEKLTEEIVQLIREVRQDGKFCTECPLYREACGLQCNEIKED